MSSGELGRGKSSNTKNASQKAAEIDRISALPLSGSAVIVNIIVQ